MMQFLNIILLSLSIATVLLTLVSYILYKMKQLPREQSRSQEKRKLNGVFFRRYLPKELLASETTAVPVASAPAPAWRKLIPRTTGGFFAVVTVSIFIALLVQQILLRSNRGDYLSDDERRAMEAQGLLKHYKLAPASEDRLMDEYIFPSEKGRLKATVGRLNAKRILLLQTAQNRAADRKRHTESFSDWMSFLGENEIAYQAADSFSSIKNGVDLVILPHPVYLSASERGVITKALEKGVAFLATGAVAVGDENNDESAADWRRQTFGINLIYNPTQTNRLPTLFVSGAPPWWDIPPGLEAPWFPRDVEYKAVAVSGTTGLFEGDYNGFFGGIEGYPAIKEVTRAQFISGPRGRSAWLALDPAKVVSAKREPTPVKADLSDAEVFYARSALIHALAWSAGTTSARVATWKDGRKSAMIVWLDTEDKFENVDAIADAFSHSGFPATFFVVSNLFHAHPTMMSHMTPQMEIATHSENHQTFYLQSLPEQFERIQISRFEIERISKAPVLGFRPPTEKYNAATVDAVIQNGLKYLAGERTFLRFSPTWVASGKLAFFSRTLNDDLSMKRAGLLDEAPDFIATVTRECDHVGRLNGVYLLGLHTQVFTPGAPMQMLAQALDELDARKYWKTNFRELYQWSRDRLNLDAVLVPNKEIAGRYLLVVRNANDTPMAGFGIYLDSGKAGELKLVDRPLASGESPGNGKLLDSDGAALFMIKQIEPKKILSFDLVDAAEAAKAEEEESR